MCCLFASTFLIQKQTHEKAHYRSNLFSLCWLTFATSDFEVMFSLSNITDVIWLFRFAIVPLFFFLKIFLGREAVVIQKVFESLRLIFVHPICSASNSSRPKDLTARIQDIKQIFKKIWTKMPRAEVLSFLLQKIRKQYPQFLKFILHHNFFCPTRQLFRNLITTDNCLLKKMVMYTVLFYYSVIITIKDLGYQYRNFL